MKEILSYIKIMHPNNSKVINPNNRFLPPRNWINLVEKNERFSGCNEFPPLLLHIQIITSIFLFPLYSDITYWNQENYLELAYFAEGLFRVQNQLVDNNQNYNYALQESLDVAF